MKIIIFGGSGFIGQKLAEKLVERGHEVISISRKGKPAGLDTKWSEAIQWVRSDILHDTNWQVALQDADWIVDAIGILVEKPSKNITYQRFIVTPVQKLSTYLSKSNNSATFLFLSANSAPFFLKKYMQAKLQAEQIINESGLPHVIFYPTLVVDHARLSSVVLGTFFTIFQSLPVMKHWLSAYKPISRDALTFEIANVIDGKRSIYTKRHS